MMDSMDRMDWSIRSTTYVFRTRALRNSLVRPLRLLWWRLLDVDDGVLRFAAVQLRAEPNVTDLRHHFLDASVTFWGELFRLHLLGPRLK